MDKFKIKKIACLIYSCAFFISGILLIVFLSILTFRVYTHSRFVPQDILAPFLSLFFIGFLYLPLTWIGIKGPTTEHAFYIILSLSFFFIAFLLEFAFSVWTSVIWMQSERKVPDLMGESFSGYLQSGNDARAWKLLENKFHCCGINGRGDYINSTCLYAIGCKDIYMKHLQYHIVELATIGFTVCLEFVIGFVTYFCFYKALRKETKRRLSERRERLRVQRVQRQMSVAPTAPIANI